MNEDRPLRPTATIRDFETGLPLDRDTYADQLWQKFEAARGDERQALISGGEAEVIAWLLDELAGVYSGEEMGRLARSMAVLLWDRRGI